MLTMYTHYWDHNGRSYETNQSQVSDNVFHVILHESKMINQENSIDEPCPLLIAAVVWLV